MSVRTYGRTQNKNLSEHEIPARALLEAAKRLSDALGDFDNRDKMDKAIDFHWQVWTIFQNEASSPTTTIPEEIKILIFKICLYIDRSILDFFGNRSEYKSHIDTFIEINRNVAQGFLHKKEENTQPIEQKDRQSSVALG